ncbi:MAG: hypothetical protein HYX67_04825 [Candidatus Melainabacteria bacterium]|nr:hypothetical protein [Candidatus Melainabacteria bacterium]
MNGTSGFQDVRSSISRSSRNRLLMKRPSTRVNHEIVLFCLSIMILFNGCSFSSTLGYRPELSTTSTSESIPACDGRGDAKPACLEYYNIFKWGEGVAQAYRTKALLNEWSLYAAGALGIIGGAVVGTLTATDNGNTDTAKIIPPVTGAFVALFALNQSDEKANAYGESIVAIEESKAAAQTYVMRYKQSKEAFETGSFILYDSIQQEIINLDIRMVAIRKKLAASIPTTTDLFPESFKEETATSTPPTFTVLTKNLEAAPGSIKVLIVPNTAVSITEVNNDRISLTLTNPKCQDYLVMLSVKNKLVLPARNLRCEN